MQIAKQQEILGKLHSRHQGIQRCRLQANSAVWWPGILANIEQYYVQNCNECTKRKGPTKEPLMTTPLPDYPWQKSWYRPIPARQQDLSDCHGLLFSIPRSNHAISSSVIMALKTIFARHGIPETVVSDNELQFLSAEFQQFAPKATAKQREE